ncbi:MAG: pyruvate formate lyase-activating protein [Clostridia bacterium]|nr:pyruvate formate lyase-activating protein [Clostridia bacterium]
MEGRISSVQSMGAVDGPGLRYVVFMQGCPLRCKYCHNPETWEKDGGTVRTDEELCTTIQRYRTYFGENGGVTVSGGEPLMQAEFVSELFERLHRVKIHTALDTSGAGDLSRAEKVLEHTDLVLCDLKFPTEEAYRANCGGSLQHTLDFLRLCEKMQIPVWIRHVVAPGLTDTPESLRAVKELCAQFSNIEKIEWLPFKNICISKYENLGIAFPMADRPAFSQKHVEELLEKL